MLVNEFRFIGTVLNEPLKQKLSEDSLRAKFILRVNTKNSGESIIPCIVYNKKAHVFCANVHKGAIIHCTGHVISKVELTKTKASPLVSLAFKVTDYDIIDYQDIQDISYDDVIDLYDPDKFTKGGSDDAQ